LIGAEEREWRDETPTRVQRRQKIGRCRPPLGWRRASLGAPTVAFTPCEDCIRHGLSESQRTVSRRSGRLIAERSVEQGVLHASSGREQEVEHLMRRCRDRDVGFQVSRTRETDQKSRRAGDRFGRVENRDAFQRQRP